MIELDGVEFLYENNIMRFDLAVAREEFLAVIGPSGAGKTTLLNLIAGFERPTRGRTLIDGIDMTDAPPEARPVSMIFQDHNSFAHLDVWTNVALGIAPHLRLSESRNASVASALERVGLADFAKRQPGELSGGERQRIAIARALVRDRPILLLDEPFTALGPALRRDMLDLIGEIKAERRLTVILVSHDPDDARRAATHTAFLADGRVVAKRPTKALFAARDLPELAAYLGSPARAAAASATAARRSAATGARTRSRRR
jgi:thiamine transport system ATP-binding protein